MPEPLTMPARAPAPPAATVGVMPRSGAPNGDAGAFENVLQAGLAGRADGATGMAVPAGPGVVKPAATPKTQSSTAASTAASAVASDDRSAPQNTDEGASDLLAALLAYGTGAVATAALAASGSEPNVSAPAAAPALTDQRPEAATAALAAAATPVQPTTAQPAPGQPALGQPAVAPPATEMVPNRDGKVDPSVTGRTAGGDALQRDWAAAAASDGRTPGDLPGIPGSQATGLTQHLPASTEAGTRTANGTAEVTEEVRSARQRRSTGRDELRIAAKSPDAAHQRDGLQDPIRPAEHQAERLTEGLTAGLTERLTERAADRPSDPAVRIDTLLRADPVSRPESPQPVPVLYADHSLGSPQWQREFGSQVTLLVSRREPQAEIRTNPPQLGPVEVRIGLQSDQVSLAFTAPHPDTRAAIENALPQLREMFAGNGLALGSVSVNAESSQQQSHRGVHQNGASRPNQEPMVAESVPPIRSVAVRLVDTFA